MRSLFLKIFLWFWLAIILVDGVFVAFDIWGRVHNPSRRHSMLGQMVSFYGQRAVESWEQGGAEALRQYCDKLRQTTYTQAVLFDEEGDELTGLPVPAGARNLADRAARSGENEIEHVANGMLAATRVLGIDGQAYVIVAEISRSPWRDVPADSAAWVWRLGAVIITGGIVCYALALYLTAPVLRLRTAARRLAAGDLSVRVAARRGRRHDEIGDLAQDFDYMAERVEALISAQQRLLQDISHELRSPLARLSVALGLARRTASAEAEVNLDRIERETERLNHLIGQLLALSRLESGTDTSEQGPIPLDQLVQEVAADAEFEAAQSHRHVCVVTSDECSVTGSPELLRRAIENVVRNAVQYTREHTEVEITLRRVTDTIPPHAVIEVRDHGPGVPAAELGDIFRPFYRVAAAHERHAGSTGLGLAISAQAVRRHGGSVNASNAPDGGLIVRIELPLPKA
jgi:signal transduction histidine kinase